MADTTSVVNFRSPQEFISYYSNTLKNELEVYDLQINKLGFIGFLLNLLGHTNYDAKQYYDSLFKEAFVATSQETENLYFHASTYGYLPTFAVPSIASGEIVFDFALLSNMLPGVIKREVIIGGDDILIGFESEGYKFLSDSKYKFIQTLNGYSSIITTKEGKVTQLPSANSEIHAPFQGFSQYEEETFDITLPNYDFGTYYPYVIEISDGHIADLRVWVQTKNSSVVEEYDVNYIKYFEESFSKTVFLRKLTSKKFVLEFGSGIRGAFIPSATITIKVITTKGKSGNLSKKSTLSTSNYLTIINYYDSSYSNKIETLPSTTASKYMKMNFSYSIDGKNPLSGDELRYDVVNHIQSYDMLVSEKDFYNIAQKYLTDFKFLFKKSNMSSNTFYLCRSFRDKYQLVCPTSNQTVKKIDGSLSAINLTTTIQDSGQLDPKIIDYIIIPSDGFNVASESILPTIDLTPRKTLIPEEFAFENGSNTVLCSNQLAYDAFSIDDYIIAEGAPVSQSLKIISKDDTTEFILTLESNYEGDNFVGQAEIYQPTSVLIEWDVVEDANKYIVYKQVDGIYYCADTYENNIIDDGTNFNLCEYPLIPNLIHFPKFMVGGKEMISPFLYKWNDFMNWYDGYLLYDSFTAYFSETKNTGLENYDIPVLYFFIQYDYLNKKTYIDLKSHQDISAFVFEITISERSIYNQSFVNIDTTTWRYEYSDENGIFWDSFHIELYARKGSDQSFEGSTYAINQIYDIKDELNVLNYQMFVYSGPSVLDHIDDYIINIPLIGYDEFIDDSQYYLDKIKQFIVDYNIEGRRMVSDNLQFRFLDTVNVSSYYLENFTVQEYDSFDINLPLKLDININVDSDIVVDQKINLAEKKDAFLLLTADWLQKNHTATNISFYNSQVVDLIHTDQSWIKSVSVVLKDSSGTIIPNGIETLPDIEGLEKISSDKLGIIKYSSWFWYWDVDNISIKMVI